MRKLVLSVLVVFVLTAVPAISEALQVEIRIDGVLATPQPPTTTTVINGKPSIEISGTYTATVGATTKSFTISTCSRLEGCSSLAARVYVDDGPTLDNLVLTDAKFTAAPGNPAGVLSVLTISFVTTPGGEGPGDLTGGLAAGLYPYAVAINGIFVGTQARNNAIDATAWANVFAFCDGPLFCGGDVINTGLPEPIPSLLAPPFSSALSASFNKQETLNINCPQPIIDLLSTDSVSVLQAGSCDPMLAGQLNVSLLPGQTLRLPGSFNAIGSNVTVEDGGLAIIAAALAALHPGNAAKVYRASLEPSPGGDTGSPIRGVAASAAAWVVDREGNGESKTRAEMALGGQVKVTAKGLCDEAACAAAKVVDVSVFCGEAGAVYDFPGALSLNAKGDGEATVSALSLPCTDPAVLITDSGSWIAAPGIP